MKNAEDHKLLLIRRPYPNLLKKLSRLRSFNSLRQAIHDWVPQDFTCIEGQTVDGMAFPPRLFADLKETDVQLLRDTFGIPQGIAYSIWASHYLDMNLFYGERSGRRNMAKQLAEGIRSVTVQGSSPLPNAVCIFLATAASMEQHKSRLRSDIMSIIREDTKRNAPQTVRVLRGAEHISRYLHDAVGRMRPDHPGDLLTTSGSVATWANRVRLLDLLTELQEILRTDPTRDIDVPRLRSDTVPLAYVSWRGLKKLADVHMTSEKGGVVASALLKKVGVKVNAETAERILRRADNPP